MQIIAVQNTKGGATKSTTSVNLAGAFHKLGFKTALGETDSQGTLREWAADAEDGSIQFPVIQLPDRDSILSVRDHKDLADTDILIIDGVANGFREFIAAEKVSDFILIVSQPSPADIKPISELVDVLEGKSTAAAFLLTRVKKGDDLTDQVRGALSEFEYPVLESTIRDLKGFKTTFGVGRTVFDYKDYRPAQEDVTAVAREILALMGVEV